MNTSKHPINEKDMQSLQNGSGLPGNLQTPGSGSIRWNFVDVDTDIRWTDALRNLLFSRLPYNAVRFNSATYREKLVQLLDSDCFDAIILENLYTAFYLNDIKKRCRSLIIMRAHNVEHEIWQRTAGSTVGVRRFYLFSLAARIRRLELSLINSYDALVPISARDAEHFRLFGNIKPVHVLPAGIEPADPPVKSGTAVDKSVAHLGALDWLPNQNGIRWFMREVWPDLRKRVAEAEFHLAGRNAPPDFGAEMARAGAVFHGEVNSASDFIQAYPVFVVPVFSGSGMRIKLLEYLAHGRAVVTTGIGAEGIRVTDGRELFLADNPSEFARKAADLLNNPGMRKEMGENAVTFVRENFNNQKLIRDFSRFLSELHDGRENSILG
jgi:glycosyltransferase involved in cell wall biosynthesis